MTDPIRVFVGCSANHEDAESQAVLEWTLRKHASREVEITWMRLSREPASPFYGWNTSQWATPFSGFRWAVPELAGGHGRALYVDSDVMFFSDVARLYDQPIPHCPRGQVYPYLGLSKADDRTGVILWDCDAVSSGPHTPTDKWKGSPNHHAAHTGEIKGRLARWQGTWNVMDGENLPLAAIDCLHYTSMPHQPHLPRARERLAARFPPQKHWYDGPTGPHWRADIQKRFDEELIEAENNGFPVSYYENKSIFPLYGPYEKQSMRSRGAGVPAWGRA